MKKIFIVLAILCMLCLYSCGTDTPVDPAPDQVDKVTEKTTEDAKEPDTTDVTSAVPETAEPTEQSSELKTRFGIESDVHVTYIYDSDIKETMHVRIQESGKEEVQALLSSDGQLIYVCKDATQYIGHAPIDKNDIGYVYSNDSDNQESSPETEAFIFFNSCGEVIRTFTYDEVDYVLACGGGKALVYKHKKTIDTAAHMYGIIDSSGEWYMEPVELESGPCNPASALAEQYYIGEGVFFVNLSDRYPRIMFDTERKNIWYLDIGYETYNVDFSFDKNGKMYFVAGGYMDNCYISDSFMWNIENGIVKEVKENIEEQCKIPLNFTLTPDGGWEEITDFSESLKNNSENYGDVFVYKEDGCLKTYNITNNQEYIFEEYSSDLIERVLYQDDCLFIGIEGLDGKDYFTYIDKECNMKFEPIEYSGAIPTLVGDKLLYDNTIIDISGNTIVEKVVPDSTIVDSWGDYSDDLVWIRDISGDYYFIYPEDDKTVVLDDIVNQKA